jgi:predicted transcriptional regulator of viral defense system
LPVLIEVASEQAGYVTANQAARLGIEQSRLARLAETGDVRRVRWGVYAMRHADHRLEDEIGAWLSIDRKRLPWERNGDPVAVLSHASAAALHGLGTLVPGYPELTVPPEHRSATRQGTISLHVAPLAAGDWMWMRSEGVRLPLTTPARTVVDLLLSGEETSYVERAIAEGLANDSLSPTELIESAQRRRQRNAELTRRIKQMLDTVA